MKLVSINPSNNEILGEVEETTQTEIIDKINLAKSAQTKWANLDIDERIKSIPETLSNISPKFENFLAFFKNEAESPINTIITPCPNAKIKSIKAA